MAESLSVKIALEGGAEIERQLAEIGQAGTKAFNDIEEAATKAGGFKNIKPEVVTNKLKDLNVTAADTTKVLAAVQTAVRYENLVQGIGTVQAAFVGLARTAGVVGVAVAAGLVALSKQTIGFAQAISKTSAEAIKLGLSFKQLDQLKLKMEQAGMPAQAISSAVVALQGNLDKLEISKLKKLAEEMAKMQRLGVRFAPGQGPDALKQFEEAAKRIGPAGDFAREAIRKINEETQKSGNIRLLPGVVPTLEQLKANADPVIAGFNQLGIAGTKVGEQSGLVTEKLKAMTDTAERNRLALLLMGEVGGTAFIQTLSSADAAEDKANKLVGAINQLTAAWGRFGSLTLAPTITAEVNALTAAIQALDDVVTNFSWATISDAAVAAGNALKYFTLQGQASLALQWGWSLGGWDALISKIRNAYDAMLGFLGLKSSAPTPSLSDTGNVSGFASGGLLGGRGTGTSDSNLAWLSRGEYVTPAHAVAQPGVLAFLEALRRSGGNLSRVLNGMGHFALGGMVPRAIPAYAAGGLNSGSNVTIQFPGVPPISGLRASSGVVDQLHKAAALAQVRSGGRKPSRYS